MSNDVYLGNPLLKKANTPIEWTKEMMEEWILCMRDPVYFAKNYIKIVNVDDGLVNFNLWKFQEKLITNFHQNRFNICKMPRQVGKMLALNTPIPTPAGWTTIEELNVGDYIFGRNGRPTKVLGKSEVQEIDTYEIEFDTGEVIKACSKHLWNVSHSDWRHKERVITTKEIIEKFESLKEVRKPSSIYINIAEAIDLPDKNLPIDPYTLGVWLGDGARNSSYIVGLYEDIENISTNIPFKIIKKYQRKDKPNVWNYTYESLKSELTKLGLHNEKYIPDEYMRASIHQRLELIRGLMDTDGSAYPNGRCEFYQKEGKLLLQVREILCSLGIKTRLSYKKIPGYDSRYGTIRFCTNKFDVFKLPRKLERQKNNLNHKKNTRLYITDIRKVKTEPMQCISVDNSEHLFLCGETFIPTHNSTTVVSYLLHYVVFNDNVNIGILANKASTSRELLSRLQLSYENLPKWMQQGIISWNKGSLELENGSKIIAASTSASAVRGMTFNIIFLDEFAFVPNHIADDFFASVYPTISSGKSTKVIIVSCVTKDTYLLTNKGYRKIDRFINYNNSGAYIVPEYSVMGKDKFYTSDIIVNNIKSPTNIIKTRYESLECSESHKLWAFKEGKYGYFKSNELSVGDYVAIKYNHQVFGNVDYIGFNPEKGKSHNTFSCNYINEEIAYFVGLYVSEGYAREIYSKETNNLKGGQIVITCGDDISESLSKLKVTFNKTDDVHYIINSKHLLQFLKVLDFDLNKKAKEKVLPDKVLSWSKKNICALLRGMFDGDGSISKKGVISYTSTSRELIRQVQLLLANLGILGSIYTATSPPTKKVKVSSIHHTIEIAGNYAFEYFNNIGFNLKRKQDRFSLIKKSNRTGSVTDIIPNSAIILKECGIKGPSARKKGFLNYSRKLLLENKKQLCKNNEIKQFFDDNIDENLIWLKIKQIEKGESEVFDVSLPDIENDKWAHSVLYNNFLGHQTPKGMNHFYRMWHDAERGKNQFVATEVHWSEVPGRDEKWKEETIANTSEEQFRAEHLCEFLGSVGTLISPSKLKSLVYEKPLKSNKGLDIYEESEDSHDYIITVDVARGVEKDYSAFVVIDITSFPHKVVAKYRNNQIKPMIYPSIIVDVAKNYNNAFILCEVNDVGDQVASIIHYDLEYTNLLMCSMRGRAGQILGQGFSGKHTQLGLKMSKTVKKIGCLNLKTLIEESKLIFKDYEIMSELTTFVQKHNSFEAEEGCNDDLAICLVLYAWLVAQDYFKELTEQDVRKRLYEEQKNQIEQDMAPFGFIMDGLEDKVFTDVDGDRWYLDEYGDSQAEFSYMWNY